MAVGILRRGHSFALANVNGIDYLTLIIDYLVRTRLGASISAI